MTFIFKAPTDEGERAKWRIQAEKAAAHMKQVTDWGGQAAFTPMFVFDDGTVRVTIDVDTIQHLDEKTLADLVFDEVLRKITMAGGESADGTAQTSGMKLGHAAPQGAVPAVGEPEHAPAGAAVSTERCSVCGIAADGGIKLTLVPFEAAAKRWGVHQLLGMVVDYPVCKACFPNLGPIEVVDQEHRAFLSRIAQHRNNGLTVDWKRSRMELVPFSDPHYIALRQEQAKHSQPGPAVPQPEGAG